MSQEARHKNIQLSTIEEERDDALAAEKPKSSSELRKPAIDDYIVLKCLGKSTFGEVMLAKSKLDKKKYALKMLSKIKMEKVASRSPGQRPAQRDVRKRVSVDDALQADSETAPLLPRPEVPLLRL